MPLTLLPGINHHHLYIVFADETEGAFVWLFENWLVVINNKAPVSIITNQDQAMSNATANVLIIIVIIITKF